MIAYIIISFLMMVTPGPGVLSLAGVGAGLMTGYGDYLRGRNA